VIAGLGIAGLVIASLLNVFLRQRQLKNQPKWRWDTKARPMKQTQYDLVVLGSGSTALAAAAPESGPSADPLRHFRSPAGAGL